MSSAVNVTRLSSAAAAAAANLDIDPEPWQTWGVGLFIVTACSFSSPAAIMLMPYLSKSLYDRSMTFLVALGVGALSGSTLFLMIPQAFHITELESFDYVPKCWIILGAVYLFFAVDRALQYAIEVRRMLKARRRRIHMSTIRQLIKEAEANHSMQSARHHYHQEQIRSPTSESSRQVRGRFMQRSNRSQDTEMTCVSASSSSHAPPDDSHLHRPHHRHHHHHPDGGGSGLLQQPQSREPSTGHAAEDADELKDEFEISMLNNALARTVFAAQTDGATPCSFQFSRRRRTAIVTPVDTLRICVGDGGGAAAAAAATISTGEQHMNVTRTIADAAARDSPFVRAVNQQLARAGDCGNATANALGPPSLAVTGYGGTATPSDATSTDRREVTEKTTTKKKKTSGVDDSDTVCVSVAVVEKRVVSPSRLEVASVAYMIIFGSSANNFVDGMSMGAAFSDSIIRGVSVGLAVVSQQFPQELGTLAILTNSGLGLKRALLFNLIPIFLSYLGFAVGVLLDDVDESYDNFVFSISAGMYLYIFLGTLIPEIRDSTNELIKEDIKESVIVTILQVLGISCGLFFLYYMSFNANIEEP